VMYSNPRFELEIQVHIIVQPFVTAYKDYWDLQGGAWWVDREDNSMGHRALPNDTIPAKNSKHKSKHSVCLEADLPCLELLIRCLRYFHSPNIQHQLRQYRELWGCRDP
jgi:hypothetical protein